MRVGEILRCVNSKCKEFSPLIQACGILAALLIVAFTYWHLKVTIENIELYRKDLLRQEIPILDFKMVNEKVDISIAGHKFFFLLTKSMRLMQLNPRIRLNLVTVDFPTRMREIVRRKDLSILLPIFMSDSLKIYPPELEWNAEPFVELIRHYYRNQKFEPNTQAYWYNQKIPISLSQQYNCFGEIRKLISIYGVEYDVFVDNSNDKVSYNIEIRNLYLIRTLGADEKHIDTLNSIFDSFAEIHQ